MVNNIIAGIALKLDETFNELQIYSESIEQGLKEPCFFISLISTSMQPLLGNRAKRDYLFDIHYFPKSKTNSNVEMLGVSDCLMEELRQIRLLDGNYINGSKLSAQTVDGVLHFFVNYSVVTNKITEQEPIESLELSVNTKGV